MFLFDVITQSPVMRCQIYGEDEKIYGYQDLVIDVSYTSFVSRHLR